MIVSKIANEIKTNLYGKNGLNKPLRAVMSNTIETFINDKNEKIVNLYDKGKLRQAQKYSADGDVVYIKKYNWIKNNHTVEILNIDNNLNVSVKAILKRTNDSITRYTGKDGYIDKYFRKFAQGWKRLDENISKEPVNAQNLKTFYIQSGKMINNFLRSGEFYNFRFANKKLTKSSSIEPTIIKQLFNNLLNSSKELNRSIIDSIPHIDKMTYSSKTKSPMVVYRDAPRTWLDSAKNGKLTDRGYCSTSTSPRASFENVLSDDLTMHYIIELPENTPFWDLTSCGEKEMTLPRNSEFLDLGRGRLRYLGQSEL